MIDCGHTCGVFQDTTADMAFLSATFVIEDGQEIDGASVSVTNTERKIPIVNYLNFYGLYDPCTLSKLIN